MLVEILASFIQFWASVIEIGLVDENVDESHLWMCEIYCSDERLARAKDLLMVVYPRHY